MSKRTFDHLCDRCLLRLIERRRDQEAIREAVVRGLLAEWR